MVLHSAFKFNETCPVFVFGQGSKPGGSRGLKIQTTICWSTKTVHPIFHTSQLLATRCSPRAMWWRRSWRTRHLPCLGKSMQKPASYYAIFIKDFQSYVAKYFTSMLPKLSITSRSLITPDYCISYKFHTTPPLEVQTSSKNIKNICCTPIDLSTHFR